MPSKQHFVIEQYAPPHPETFGYVRVHSGTFEANRDNLSPSMIDAREVIAPSRESAIIRAKEQVQQLNNKINKKRTYKYTDI